jgi:hypothetical protein
MSTNSNILNKEPVPLLVKVCEVAKLLSVSRHTVYHLIDSGDLLAKPINPTKKKKTARPGKVKPRTHVRVTRDSLSKFYEVRFGQPLANALVNPFKS